MHTVTHCNTLQQLPATTHCNNSRQHTATHCNTLQGIATHGKTLQHTATHINALQARTGVIAVASSQYRSTLQHTATHCNTLHHTAASYSTWRESFAAASSSLLHIAPHCNALPLPASPYSTWRESVVALSSSPIPLCNTLQLAADYNPLQYLAGTVCSSILCVPSCSSHESQFFFDGHVCPFFSCPSTHHRSCGSTRSCILFILLYPRTIALRCNSLQKTATHCNTLKLTATRYRSWRESLAVPIELPIAR